MFRKIGVATKIKIEHMFIMFGIIFGMLFVVILPPFQAPDELAHFYKAYGISEGQFFCTSEGDSNAGSYLPSNITEFVIGTDSTNTKRTIESLKSESKFYPSSEKIFVEHYSSCVYNILPYIPQSIGIFVGDLLKMNFISIFYIGRVLNLAVYLSICFLSIRLVPKLKKVLMLLALMPMALQQASSLSADALTNAVSFLLFCYILNLKYKDGNLHRVNLIIISVLSIIVSLLKITYFPLALLVFLIPHEKYQTLKKYFFKNSMIVFVSMTSAISWLLITRTMKIVFPVDPKIQLSFILNNPLNFTKLLVNNIFNYDGLYLQFVGILAWLNLSIPMLFYILYYVMFFVAIFIEGSKDIAITKHKLLSSLISIGIFIICYILVETSLYLNWPQSSPAYIDGVQGRYFIPIVLSFFYGLFLLTPIIIKYSKIVIAILLIGVMIKISMIMIQHYYFFGPDYELLEPNNNHYIENGILPDTKFEQSFIADKNKLSGISIYVSTFQKKIVTPYVLELRDKTNSIVVRKLQMNVGEIADNAYYNATFEPINNSNGETYVLSVYPIETKVLTPLTFQLSRPNLYLDGDLYIRGMKYEEDIVFRLIY